MDLIYNNLEWFWIYSITDIEEKMKEKMRMGEMKSHRSLKVLEFLHKSPSSYPQYCRFLILLQWFLFPCIFRLFHLSSSSEIAQEQRKPPSFWIQNAISISEKPWTSRPIFLKSNGKHTKVLPFYIFSFSYLIDFVWAEVYYKGSDSSQSIFLVTLIPTFS